MQFAANLRGRLQPQAIPVFNINAEPTRGSFALQVTPVALRGKARSSSPAIGRRRIFASANLLLSGLISQLALPRRKRTRRCRLLCPAAFGWARRRWALSRARARPGTVKALATNARPLGLPPLRQAASGATSVVACAAAAIAPSELHPEIREGHAGGGSSCRFDPAAHRRWLVANIANAMPAAARLPVPSGCRIWIRANLQCRVGGAVLGLRDFELRFGTAFAEAALRISGGAGYRLPVCQCSRFPVPQ
ncbi:hypothetical protein ACVIW0_004776 [Bradyrhizobium sp. USDA 4454]